MKLTKLFKKARLGKRRKGEVSDIDTEASVPRQRPVITPASSVSLTSPSPQLPPRPAITSARRHNTQQQAVATQSTHVAATARLAPSPKTVTHSSRKTTAAPTTKFHPHKPAVFHDIMPPRGTQRSRRSSFTKPSAKPQPPQHTLSPSRASLIKPTAATPTPVKRPLNKLSSVKAQPVKPLSSHPPLTKPPLSSHALTPNRPLNPVAAASSRRSVQPSVAPTKVTAKSPTGHPGTNPRTTTSQADAQLAAKRPLSQSHQLPTQPALPPQPKELTHPRATAHSRAHIAVPSRHPQLTHRPPHIRAMDMVHR